MKITTFILLVAVMSVSARTVAQKITLSEKNASLADVLNQIRRQSGYDVICRNELLSTSKPITVSIKEASLDEALKASLQNQPLVYEIQDGAIIIRAKEENLIDRARAFLAQVTISGKVQDETGQPLAGVTVRVKNTRSATATDAKGTYTITVPDNTNILIFSFVGFETQELTARDIINGSVITLKAVATNLNEVVVNKGPYSVKQEFNTGSSTHIDGAIIAQSPVSDPIQALIGRVPGLSIQQTSGIPGANSTVNIRGQNSIANGNDPLFIVDGVPFSSASLTNPDVGNQAVGRGTGGSGFNGIIRQTPGQGMSPFNNLDPSNIESIEVLKDADATAIYGSRGANGVILITTKRGKPGKTKADITMSQGVGHIASSIDLMNTQQYLNMRRQAFQNDGLVIPNIKTSPNDDNYDINGAWDQSRYTDWQKVLIGNNAQYTNVQTNISGGNNNTQFVFGGGYNRQTTVFPGDYADQKGSAHFNLTHSSTDQKFHTTFSAQYVNDNNVIPQVDFTGNITLPPDAPALYNNDGTINWAYDANGFSTFNNPMAAALRSAKAVSNQLISNLSLSYEILPGLQLHATAGYNKTEMNQTNQQPATSVSGPPSSNNRWNYLANSNLNTWIIEPQISYSKHIFKGNLDVLIGMTQQRQDQNSISYVATGFTSDALIGNPAFASYFSLNGSNYVSEYRYAALYGRIGYTWDEKYILNLTARRDGSSRFGPANEFGNFGAIGSGWIFSKEKWASSLSWLSFGKLRASYGTTGNDQIPNYQYLSTYSAFSQNYQGVSTLYPSGIANPYFGWEVVKKLEGGLELGFLKDRIYVAVDYYRNRTDNQLVGYLLPTTAGFASVYANLPAVVQNTGFEISLNTTNIKGNAFSWTSSLNLSIPKNKLVSFPGLDQSSYKGVRQIGSPLTMISLYHYTGLNSQTGLYTFQDLNNDGVLNASDKQFLKDTAPRYYGGFNNTFSYKGLSLDIFFQFVKQTGLNYLNSFNLPGSEYANEPTLALNVWQNPGDKTAIQRFSQGGIASTTLNNLKVSDAVYTDASFIRLKNLAFSYRLPTTALQKMHIQNLRLFIQGQNLLTFTKYQGLDPENQNAKSLPPLRMITGGLEIGL